MVKLVKTMAIKGPQYMSFEALHNKGPVLSSTEGSEGRWTNPQSYDLLTVNWPVSRDPSGVGSSREFAHRPVVTKQMLSKCTKELEDRQIFFLLFGRGSILTAFLTKKTASFQFLILG